MSRKIISLLKKEILSSWGKKCKDFCFDCSVCRAHQTLENLESMFDLYYSDYKYKPKKK